MAEIYLSEVLYEALFDTTIDATSYPTTTNFLAVENYIANLLHGKLGIDTALTTNPALSMARMWVGLAIKIFSASNKAEQDYVSPEVYLASEDFILKIDKMDGLVNSIRDSLDEEDPPAYYYDLDTGYRSGSEL